MLGAAGHNQLDFAWGEATVDGVEKGVVSGGSGVGRGVFYYHHSVGSGVPGGD